MRALVVVALALVAGCQCQPDPDLCVPEVCSSHCCRENICEPAEVCLAPVGLDAGTPDAGAQDAGTLDAGTPDAGTPDAGTPDAGTPDAGTHDAGTLDAGTLDAGTHDAGTPDAGMRDAGTSDAGPCVRQFSAAPERLGNAAPEGMTTADFNLDGIPDVVATAANSVDLYLSSGTVALAAPLATGLRGERVTSGDFTGDHKPDLITHDNFSARYSMAAGNGDGTFQSPTTVPCIGASSVASLEAADLNGDGRLDLFAGATGGTACVALGSGDGGFQVSSLTLDTQLNDVAVADFNRDTKLDLLSVGSAGMQFRAGVGNGTFLAPTTVSPLSWASVIAGDFDADGKLDLVAAFTEPSGTTFQVMRGVGNGTFLAPSTLPLGPFTWIGRLTRGELTGDGIDDLVISSMEDNWVQVFAGSATGLHLDRRYSTGSNPYFSVVTDVDRDGAGDLVVAVYGLPYSLMVLRGAGARLEGAQSLELIPRFEVLLQSAVGDLNRDRRDDLVAATSVGLVFLTSVDGGTWARTWSDAGVSGVALGDFNGNGVVDLATTSRSGLSVGVDWGTGSGSFSPGLTVPLPVQVAQLVSGDFNEDGHPDLAALEAYGGGIYLLRSNGSGGFAPAVRYATSSGATQLSVGDFNGDHHLDLSVVSTGTITVLRGSGTGTLTADAPIQLSAGDLQVATGDLDGDGRTDLALASGSGAGVGVGLSLPAGGFAVSWVQIATTRATAEEVRIADLDGDGRGEVVVTMRWSSEIATLRRISDGGFAAEFFAVAEDPRRPAIGDFDGDGKPDLVVLDAVTNSVGLLINRCR